MAAFASGWCAPRNLKAIAASLSVSGVAHSRGLGDARRAGAGHDNDDLWPDGLPVAGSDLVQFFFVTLRLLDSYLGAGFRGLPFSMLGGFLRRAWPFLFGRSELTSLSFEQTLRILYVLHWALARWSCTPPPPREHPLHCRRILRYPAPHPIGSIQLWLLRLSCTHHRGCEAGDCAAYLRRNAGKICTFSAVLIAFLGLVTFGISAASCVV